MLLWIFGLAKARAGKGYRNREREWRGSASWLAFVPAVHSQSTTGPKATPFRRLVAGIDLIRPNFEVRQLCLPMERG